MTTETRSPSSASKLLKSTKPGIVRASSKMRRAVSWYSATDSGLSRDRKTVTIRGPSGLRPGRSPAASEGGLELFGRVQPLLDGLEGGLVALGRGPVNHLRALTSQKTVA